MKIVIFFLLPLAFLTGLTLSARAETDYFPPGVWGDGPWETTAVENDERYENWYGKNLAAMNEKRLWDQQARDKATMSVRLLFLPTFDDPAMLQFSLLVDGSISYVFKGLDGKSGYELGKLARKSKGKADAESIAEIKLLLNTIDALNGGTPTQIFNRELVCTDGTQAVLEFAGDGKYNVLGRHECEMKRNDPIRKLIHLLDKVSGGKVISPPDTFIDRG